MDVTNATFFERKIKPVLLYIGSIGAALASAAYIGLVCILIFGFLAHNPVQTFIFAIINAIIGLIIMQFLKMQGQDFASNLPQNKPILEEYYRTKTKDKKLRSMRYYWIKTTVTDTLTKGFSILVTTIGIIYIVVQGSQDYTLFIMAFVNLIMFFCFGLIALSKTYDFFNNRHMAYVQEQLRIIKEQEIEKDEPVCKDGKIPKATVAEREPQIEGALAEEIMAMAPQKLPQPPDDNTCLTRRSDILESIISTWHPGDNQPVVLDSVECSMGCVGGNTTSDTYTNVLHTNDTQNIH